MISKNFIEPISLMLYVKFKNHRPPGSGEEYFKVFVIYSHGGHLYKLSFSLPKDAPHEV